MQFLKRLSLGGALLFSALAVPSHASIIVSLTTSTAGGTFTLGGSSPNFTLSALSGVLFTGISVAGDTISAANGNFSLIQGTANSNCTSASGATLKESGNSLELWGAIGGGGATYSNISTGCNLLFSFTNTNGWKGTTSGTTATISLNNATSISESSLLLQDLGAVGTSNTSALLGGSAISGSGSGGTGSYNATSEQATFLLAQAPEPFTSSLMGAGLLTLTWLARRRKAPRA